MRFNKEINEQCLLISQSCVYQQFTGNHKLTFQHIYTYYKHTVMAKIIDTLGKYDQRRL